MFLIFFRPGRWDGGVVRLRDIRDDLDVLTGTLTQGDAGSRHAPASRASGRVLHSVVGSVGTLVAASWHRDISELGPISPVILRRDILVGRS
jgi:hypothetical protein